MASVDGVPDAENTQDVYDRLDLNRATEDYPSPAVGATKKLFRIYSFTQKDNPPKVAFVNVSRKFVSVGYGQDLRQFKPLSVDAISLVASASSYGLTRSKLFIE